MCHALFYDVENAIGYHPLQRPARAYCAKREKPLPPTPDDEAWPVGTHMRSSSRPPAPKAIINRSTRLKLLFNPYLTFLLLVLTLNWLWILLAASGKWDYARRYSGAFVLANIQTAILVRSELFLRLLYLSVNTLFAKWPPLRFRLACTSTLQHIGGVHAGCAISAFFWLAFHLALLSHERFPPAIVAFGVLTALALGVGLISAIPWVREVHHNVFERWHRFAGWTGLFLTWIFLALSYSYDPTNRKWSLDSARFIRQQDIWYLVLSTILIIIPWCTIRKVRVHVDVPSSKVAVIRFDRGMQQGLVSRVARNPLWENHAFGIISEGVHSGCHYLVCGVQGDFTGELVRDPPTHLWTRELKLAGVSNTCPLYKRGVRICTGTGIGAALSTCLQSEDWYLIWIGAGQEETFGPVMTGLIKRRIAPERMTLWDSRTRGGRPDVMKLIKRVYSYWRAEVVFITSNRMGNKEMMEGCKQAGIPAFGTLWDF